MENTEIIKGIIKAIEVGPDKRTFFNGTEYNQFPPSPELGISDEMLSQNLQGLIYGQFYCRGEEALMQAGNAGNNGIHPVGPMASNQDFIQGLREHNHSTDGWSKNWVVESASPQNAFYVKKGNSSRYAYPGEFIKESFSHKAAAENDMVKLVTRREFNDKGSAFYYVFGKTLADDNNEYLVRFYFNLVPDGSAPLISLLTEKFNQYFIPFQFKCLNAPELYTRCDSAVLYFDKRYFRIAYTLLYPIYSQLGKFLKPHCPLFTYEIADGFGFAENPPKPTDSFGTNRCKLIASGIVDAVKAGEGKDKWMDAIVKKVTESEHSLDKFYLNPRSKSTYNFAIPTEIETYELR